MILTQALQHQAQISINRAISDQLKKQMRTDVIQSQIFFEIIESFGKFLQCF